MELQRYKRRAATRDNPPTVPRSNYYLPWTQIVTRKHRTRAPQNYGNGYSPKNSRFYAHVSPPLASIAEETGLGGDHTGRDFSYFRNSREQLELKQSLQPQCDKCGKCVNRAGANDDQASDEFHRSNVDDGILTTKNVRLHDLLSRQKIANQYAPSSPVDEHELKETTPGSIFEKTEFEKCMPMVRANSPNLTSEGNDNTIELGHHVSKRDWESDGFWSNNPNIVSGSNNTPSYRWVDFDNGSRDRLGPGRFRNIYSGSNGKDRLEELTKIGREYRIHPIDVGGFGENDAVNYDGLVCLDCLDEQCRRPGAICRRCQYARVNRELAEVQRKAYDMYLETGQLARKPGDVVEVVNYRNGDVKKYRRVKNKNNIRKMFNRIGGGSRGSLDTRRRRSEDGFRYDDDDGDDEDDDFDDDGVYYGYDDCAKNECDMMRLNEGVVGGEPTSMNVEGAVRNKKKKKGVTRKNSVKSRKEAKVASFSKTLDLVRKNSVESWLKKRGRFTSSGSSGFQPKHVVSGDVAYTKGKSSSQLHRRRVVKRVIY